MKTLKNFTKSHNLREDFPDLPAPSDPFPVVILASMYQQLQFFLFCFSRLKCNCMEKEPCVFCLWFRHEFEQTLGDSEGQGSLECCSLWGCKESDTTYWLGNNSTLDTIWHEIESSTWELNKYLYPKHINEFLPLSLPLVPAPYLAFHLLNSVFRGRK